MLPCSDFQDNSKATTETMQVMTVSDASPATANRVTVVDPWRDWDGDGSNSDGAATIDGDSDGAATVVNDFVPAATTLPLKLKPGKRVQFQETGEIETGTELSGEKPCKEVLSDNSSCQPETAQDMKTTANWNKAEITLCSLGTCRRTGQPTKHRLHVLTNANISSDPQCHCDQYQEQHEHDIDRNAKVDSRQLAIGMILDSLTTTVPGFACEPCGVGPSQAMRTADDVASKGRVDESQPELGKQKQSQLETNAKRKKSKHGKRIQFQETGELETKTELSGETGHPEAKVSATHTSYPTNQQKRDKERK